MSPSGSTVSPLSCSNCRCRSPRLYAPSSTRSRCPSRKCAPSIDWTMAGWALVMCGLKVFQAHRKAASRRPFPTRPSIAVSPCRNRA